MNRGVGLHGVGMVNDSEFTTNLDYYLNWHPETDYLGNHVLSSAKFRNVTGWSPKYTFDKGLIKSWRSILVAGKSYNPLVHLQEARKKGVDLNQFFPKKM